MKIKITPFAFFSCLVLFIAYFTYFHHYWYPAALFWDENYRLTSAFQYLHHVMFMEYHPPLGKLFIALGEYLFHPNVGLDMNRALQTDYIKSIPAGFSFVGVRFFPILFATISSVLFFSILYKISRNGLLSYLFAFLYLFDNALIVHSRGANIDSVQIFFVLALLLSFVIAIERKTVRIRDYFFMGLLVGLIGAVKLSGFLFLVIFLPLLFYEKNFLKINLTVRQTSLKLGSFLFATLLTFGGVFYIHGLLGQQIVDGHYFAASPQYRQIIAKHQTANPLSLPIIIRDNLTYTIDYGKGIPKYDPLKEMKDGNASLPITWPFGNKSINYRWDSKDGITRYLYLQGNPLVWFVGLVGIILASALVLAVTLYRLPIRNKRHYFYIQVFLGLYVLHMISLSLLDRVLFLYSYFIPLLLSFFVAFMVYLSLFGTAWKRKKKPVIIATVVFAILIVSAFLFFSPLTYYLPLTQQQFLERSWLPFWYLKPI